MKIDYKSRIIALISETKAINMQSEYIRVKYMSRIIYNMKLIAEYTAIVKRAEIKEILR